MGPPIQYYIPDGMMKPTHLRGDLAPCRVENGKGPDLKQGVVLGGLYHPATLPRWQKTSEGWWFFIATASGKLEQQDLDQLLRLRGELYREVELDGLRWRVARLLDKELTTQPDLITEFGALDKFGMPSVHQVVRHEPLQQRIANMYRGVRIHEDIEQNNIAVLRLACDVIALWYHLSAFELFGAGLVTWAFADLVLSAAADLAVEVPKLVDLVKRMGGRV